MFLSTGLGKSICQLTWAHEVFNYTNNNVLILAPLAVADQTVREGSKFSIHGGSENGKRQTGELRNPTKEQFTQWQDFPTQSPLCSGDDGLSTELDGITFSKWRNESIKAYGNAIVPQVALQIYKAIEAYEKQVG